MKKLFKFFFVLSFIFLNSNFLFSALHPSSAVTYSFSGGRLGDNLLAVAHAKWLSYNLKIPLLYRPFEYSNHFQLSVDPSVLFTDPAHFPQKVTLRNCPDHERLWGLHFAKETSDSLLITVPYYPESNFELLRDNGREWPSYTLIDWGDPAFVKELKALFTPIVPLPEMHLPADRINVAVHVRTGVGYDGADFKLHWPLKWCPISYYNDTLNILWNMYKKPMYVFVFTDDPNPEQYVQMFTRNFSGRDVVFACRKTNNAHNLNVVEDLFFLGKFDCLIRTESNYGVIASKIFPYDVVISPLSFKGHPRKGDITVDKIVLEIGAANGTQALIKTVIHR